MTDLRVQIDGFFGISPEDSERWNRLYDKGVTIARLKGFCAHTKGCKFAAQDYPDKLFDGAEKCTCGLHDLLRTALIEAEAATTPRIVSPTPPGELL